MTEPAPIVELQPPDTTEITYATDGASIVVDTSSETATEIVLASGEPDVLVVGGGEGPPGRDAAVIDDATATAETTYSSQQIESRLAALKDELVALIERTGGA